MKRFHLLLLAVLTATLTTAPALSAQATDEQAASNKSSSDKSKEQTSSEKTRDESTSGSNPVDFPSVEGPIQLRATHGVHITLKSTESSVVVYQAIARQGKINVIFDPDYTPRPVTIDVTGVSLEDALRIAAFLTRTFWRPVTSDTIFVASDTQGKRREFEQQIAKTFYLPNVIEPTEMQDIVNQIRVVVDVQRIQQLPSYQSFTVRATPQQLALVEKLLDDLNLSRTKNSGQYRVEIRVRESGDKAPSSRTYSILVKPRELAKLRIGPQIPIETADKTKTYLSAGKNIDCLIRSETERTVSVRAIVEFSDVSLDEHGTPQSSFGDPVMQQLRMESTVILELGTPSVIGSFEDPVSKRNIQIEALAVRTKTRE